MRRRGRRVWVTDTDKRALPEPGCAQAAHLDEIPPETASRRRAIRPSLVPGLPITEYSRSELVSLTRYVNSDGNLYTDRELVDQMAQELGKRKGSRVVAALSEAIRDARLPGLLPPYSAWRNPTDPA